jgi:hypothetical protein
MPVPEMLFWAVGPEDNPTATSTDSAVERYVYDIEGEVDLEVEVWSYRKVGDKFERTAETRTVHMLSWLASEYMDLRERTRRAREILAVRPTEQLKRLYLTLLGER